MSETEAQQEARLLRVVKHYTGGENVKALLEHAAFKTALSQAGGDADLAMEFLSVNKEKNISLNGWFLANRTKFLAKEKREKGVQPEKYVRVLLPNGEARNVTVEAPFQLDFLAPVTISGVTKTVNVGAGTITYKLESSASVAAGGHSEPAPQVPFGPLLAEARQMRSFGDLKGKVRVNEVKDVYFTGTVQVDEEGRGVFVRESEDPEKYPSRVSINVVDSSGATGQMEITEFTFESQFGFGVQDADAVKDALAGRTFKAFGGVDVTAKLPEKMEQEYGPALIQFHQSHVGTNKRSGKREIKERAPIPGTDIIIESVYAGKDGMVFKTDVSQLGYQPTLTVEPRSGVNDNGEWSMGEGYLIQFDGVTKGKKPVKAEFKGMSELLSKFTAGA